MLPLDQPEPLQPPERPLDRSGAPADPIGQRRIGGPADGLAAGVIEQGGHEPDIHRAQPGIGREMVRNGGEGGLRWEGGARTLKQSGHLLRLQMLDIRPGTWQGEPGQNMW